MKQFSQTRPLCADALALIIGSYRSFDASAPVLKDESGKLGQSSLRG